MTFAGLSNPEDRANVMAFLNQHSDSPQPLPKAPAADTGQKAADNKPIGNRSPSAHRTERAHRTRSAYFADGPRNACPTGGGETTSDALRSPDAGAT